MNKLSNLHSVIACLVFGCLFVTTPIAFSQAGEDTYHSTIQDSRFLVPQPRYETKLWQSWKKDDDQRVGLVWGLSLSGESFQTSSNIQSQTATYGFKAKFRYKIMDNLELRSKANLAFQSGRTQDIFGDLEPVSGIYLRRALLQWTPFGDWLKLDAGVISQRWLDNELFIRGGAGFPGARQYVKYKAKNYSVGFTAQQLIPTSATLSTQVAEKEATPTFNTQTLNGDVRLGKYNVGGAQFTLFQFANLPRVVAWESGKWGNNIVGGAVQDTNTRFRSNFGGWVSELWLEQKFTNNFSAQIGMDVIKNTQAEDSTGESQSIQLSAAYQSGQWVIAPSVNSYFIEPDAVPAFYNSSIYGHNNRIGTAYTLGVESKKWNTLFNISFIDSQILQENGLTPTPVRTQPEDQQTIYISVETAYDLI